MVLLVALVAGKDQQLAPVRQHKLAAAFRRTLILEIGFHDAPYADVAAPWRTGPAVAGRAHERPVSSRARAGEVVDVRLRRPLVAVVRRSSLPLRLTNA